MYVLIRYTYDYHEFQQFIGISNVKCAIEKKIKELNESTDFYPIPFTEDKEEHKKFDREEQDHFFIQKHEILKWKRIKYI